LEISKSDVSHAGHFKVGFRKLWIAGSPVSDHFAVVNGIQLSHVIVEGVVDVEKPGWE